MEPASTRKEWTYGEYALSSSRDQGSDAYKSNNIVLPIRAVGCIFGELLNGSPLFPGENDIEQLCCVLRTLGTPTAKTWPVSKMSVFLLLHTFLLFLR